MSFAASLLPVLLLTAAATALGAAALAALLPESVAVAVQRRDPTSLTDAWALSASAGLVLVFVLQLALDALAIPWRRVSLAAAVLALGVPLTAAAAARLRRALGRGAATPATASATQPLPPAVAAARRGPWGLGLVAAVVAAFTWAVTTRRVAIPDFVYHWGLKGERYHRAGGIDFAFLADPLPLTEHPDYPNLLPSLYAATAHVRGFFDEISMLLWSVLFLLLLALLARNALARGGVRDGWLEAGTALVALVTGMFAVGYDLAGGGDLVIALALLAALPALLAAVESAQDPRPGDLRVAIAAALAAATKIEGVTLAAVLLAARLWVARGSAGGRGQAAWRRGWLRRLPWLLVPPALVILPWLAAAVHYRLFGDANPGSPDLARLRALLPAVLEALGTREWHGFAWLMLLLPWPLAVRRTRTAALVLAVQGGFYLAVYLGAPVDVRFYVLSSLPRLLVHLLPALLVLLVLLTPAAVPRRRE